MERVRSGGSSKVHERTVGRGGKQNAREESMRNKAQNAREETFLPMVFSSQAKFFFLPAVGSLTPESP
jgi:hypothetical protein